MFPLNSMFGMYDTKTIQDTCMKNEEFLEKVIEKLPYIGEEYKKEKEEQERAKESLDGVEEPNGEEERAEEVKVESANESVLEKIKKGIGSYLSGWFGSGNTNTENVLPRDDQYTAVMVTSPTQEIRNKHHLVMGTETQAVSKTSPGDDQ